MKKNAVWIILFVVVLAVFVGIGLYRKGGSKTVGGIRIGVIPKETASQYWKGVKNGAEQAAKEEKVTVLWNGPEVETDFERQRQIAEDMLAQKVDGIILAPGSRKALVPVVEMIAARNVPCVIVDSGVETDKYLSFMATDNYKGGDLAAKRIGEILAGKGKIIVVAWTPNSASTDARFQGFRDTLTKEFPEIERRPDRAAEYPAEPGVQEDQNGRLRCLAHAGRRAQEGRPGQPDHSEPAQDGL